MVVVVVDVVVDVVVNVVVDVVVEVDVLVEVAGTVVDTVVVDVVDDAAVDVGDDSVGGVGTALDVEASDASVAQPAIAAATATTAANRRRLTLGMPTHRRAPAGGTSAPVPGRENRPGTATLP